MNYLAHALDLCHDPYQVAGVAVPDWLGLTRPRLRCRSRHAAPLADADDPQLAAVARGVLRHHADDDWFHQTPAFGDLSIELSRRVRCVTGDVDGMRPSFLGHILVELLLDSAIIVETPEVLETYYAALDEVEPHRVAGSVGRMIDADAMQLAPIIEKFLELRFLADYPDDERLTMRLNQVMRRVRLPELPREFMTMLPDARTLIAASREQLLTAPAETVNSLAVHAGALANDQ